MKLSIIIPYYNTKAYTDELLNCLNKQITSDIEVILVDDGSKEPYTTTHKWCQVVRQKNGGVSAARNKGLDLAKGDFITFIDSDDLVTDDYIRQIMDRIEAGCDYIYMSWKTIGTGWQATVILRTLEDKFPPDNLCVWNRVYRRELIGKVRFNTSKLIAEDAEFIRLVETKGKKAIISDPIYLYRSDTPNSLSKRFVSGELNTRRVVYYYKTVTSDMTDLLKSVKKDDKTGEVIVMTDKNEIPELENYAMVIPPRRIIATEAKGDPCNLISLIRLPEKCQVVIWTSYAQRIGGIETFIYYFCKEMHKYYDILVLYDKMDPEQIARLSAYVECRKNSDQRIECNRLLVNRIIDDLPKNVKADKIIQMVHGARVDYATVPQDRDEIICVSDYVKDTWTDLTKDAGVIHNIMSMDEAGRPPLMLVTASRLDAPDKGGKRMLKLAQLMDQSGINYIWLCFANKPLNRAPKGMVFMDPTLDILPWIQKANYLVQLSDEEAFCYSIFEALELGTAVLTTPLGILDEFQIRDGIHGYVVPYEVDGFDCKKLFNIPQFEYEYDNASVIKQWRKLLGNTKPKHTYKPEALKTVTVTRPYYDIELKRDMYAGEVVQMPRLRAGKVCDAGYARMMEG